MIGWLVGCCVLAAIHFTPEPIDPTPPPPRPETGCVLIVTTAGPIVICR